MLSASHWIIPGSPQHQAVAMLVILFYHLVQMILPLWRFMLPFPARKCSAGGTLAQSILFPNNFSLFFCTFIEIILFALIFKNSIQNRKLLCILVLKIIWVPLLNEVFNYTFKLVVANCPPICCLLLFFNNRQLQERKKCKSA